FANAIDESWNAKATLFTEYEGVQPRICQPRIDHVNPFEARNRPEKESIFKHHEVSAFNQRDSHASCEKSMFRIDRTRDTGGQKHQRRIRSCGNRTQFQKHVSRYIGNRFHWLALKQFGQNTDEKPPILDHVGEAGGVAEIVVLNHKRAFLIASDTK